MVRLLSAHSRLWAIEARHRDYQQIIDRLALLALCKAKCRTAQSCCCCIDRLDTNVVSSTFENLLIMWILPAGKIIPYRRLLDIVEVYLITYLFPSSVS